VVDALRPADVVADPLGWSTISYAASQAAFHDVALVPGIDHLLEHLGVGRLWGPEHHTLTNSEAPDHGRLRRVLTPWFTPKRVAALRERTATSVAARLEQHRADGRVDVMADLAAVVPAEVFAWMLGAGPDDAVLFAEWSKALILVFTARPEVVGPVRSAKADIAAYSRELLAHKAAHPDDGLASVLAQARAAGTIGEADALRLLEELLSAAVDNTTNTTGCAVHALATVPGAWRAARGVDVAAVVEEVGRFQPAIRHTIKFAVADTELAGTPLPAGSFLTIRVAAAHRDPLAFERPHELDLHRRASPGQLAFGAGRHHCLGASLARMEVQEMVGGLLRRFPEVAVGDGVEASIVADGHVLRLPLEVAR
jgi:cytochrome P450